MQCRVAVLALVMQYPLAQKLLMEHTSYQRQVMAIGKETVMGYI